MSIWGNTLVDGHNRYAILQKHPEICFSTMPLRFANREEALAWICKNQLGRRNLTPEQKKFLIGKQYSVEHRKPGGNGNNQHTAAAKKTAPEELCQFDTIPPGRFSWQQPCADCCRFHRAFDVPHCTAFQ